MRKQYQQWGINMPKNRNNYIMRIDIIGYVTLGWTTINCHYHLLLKVFILYSLFNSHK